MITTDRELEILKLIHKKKEQVRQRDLAEITGLSLGMTNAILHRLANKGWIKIRRLNNRNILYAVTPQGVEEIMRRSYRFFKRTVRNVVVYREAIEELIKDAKEKNYNYFVLVGKSDLDFIVEYVCHKHGLLQYHENDSSIDPNKVFYIYSETYIPEMDEIQEKDGVFLQSLFL